METSPHGTEMNWPLVSEVLRGHTDSIKDHENRIRRIEKVMWVGLGASAAAGSVVGNAISNLAGG